MEKGDDALQYQRTRTSYTKTISIHTHMSMFKEQTVPQVSCLNICADNNRFPA